jgi:hypothetical protein
VAARRPNHRRVKIHRSYTVEGAAIALGIHRNTVRRWLKENLPAIDQRRPTLILGRDLADFLKSRRLKNKRPCQPGEIFCVQCRAPVKPAGNMADCQPATGTLGTLIGICPHCGILIYRRVNMVKLDQIRGQLDITITKSSPQIGETNQPIVNSDFGRASETQTNAQSQQ